MDPENVLAVLAFVLVMSAAASARAQDRGDGFVQGVLPVGQAMFGFGAGGDVHLSPGVGVGAEAGLLAPFYWYFTPYGVVHFTNGRQPTRPFLSGGLLLAKMFDPPVGLVGATTSVGVEYEIRRRQSLRFEIAHTRARHVSITWIRVGLAFR